MCQLLKSCVQLLWWVAKHKMDDKCMLDGWNVVQAINVFIATLIWLFFNYTIQLQVNLANNAQINHKLIQ